MEEDEFSEFIIDNESDKCQKILDEIQENFSRVLTNRPSFLKRFWNLFSKEEKELEKISEIGNSLERFFEEVSHRQVNLSYKEFYSLRHMVETFYYANGLKNVENKNFFITFFIYI